MFNSFKSNIIPASDFNNYFNEAYFLWPFGEEGSPPQVASYFGVEAYLYTMKKPLGSHTGRYENLNRVQDRYIRDHPELFNYPTLGYAPVTENGLLVFSHISPRDQSRRGFNPSRITHHFTEESTYYFASLDKPRPSILLSELYAHLHGGFFGFSRYTDYSTGIEKVLSGELFGFVVNPKTAVCLSSLPDCAEYPIVILYNETVIAKVTESKQIVSVSKTMSCIDRLINKRAA